jgi:cyanate permease
VYPSVYHWPCFPLLYPSIFFLLPQQRRHVTRSTQRRQIQESVWHTQQGWLIFSRRYLCCPSSAAFFCNTWRRDVINSEEPLACPAE